MKTSLSGREALSGTAEPGRDLLEIDVFDGTKSLRVNLQDSSKPKATMACERAQRAAKRAMRLSLMALIEFSIARSKRSHLDRVFHINS